MSWVKICVVWVLGGQVSPLTGIKRHICPCIDPVLFVQCLCKSFCRAYASPADGFLNEQNCLIYDGIDELACCNTHWRSSFGISCYNHFRYRHRLFGWLQNQKNSNVVCHCGQRVTTLFLLKKGNHYEETMNVNTVSVFDLSTPEKLQLVEDLWDDLAATPSDVPVYEWQKEELARRKSNLLNNPASGLSWAEVKSKVRIRHGR